MRRLAAIFLLVIIITMSAGTTVFAADSTDYGDNEGNWLTRMVVTFFGSLFGGIETLATTSLENVVLPEDGDYMKYFMFYADNPSDKVSEKEMIFGSDRRDGISEFLRLALMVLVGAVMPAFMVWNVMKYQNVMGNPERMQSATEMVIRWVLAACMIIISRQIFMAMYDVNSYLVNFIRSVYMDYSGDTDFNFMNEISFANYGILWFVIWGGIKLLTIWIAYVVYPLRFITLLLLYTLSPVILMQFIFESRIKVVYNLLGEFFGTCITQSIHGFLFLLLSMLTVYMQKLPQTNRVKILEGAILLLFLWTMLSSNKIVRSWLGIDTSGHNYLSQLGIGTLFTVGTMLAMGGLTSKGKAGIFSGAGMAGKTAGNMATSGMVNSNMTDNGNVSLGWVKQHAETTSNKIGKTVGAATGALGAMSGLALGPGGLIMGYRIGKVAGYRGTRAVTSAATVAKDINKANELIRNDAYLSSIYGGDTTDNHDIYNEGIASYMDSDQIKHIQDRNKADIAGFTVAGRMGSNIAKSIVDYRYKKSKSGNLFNETDTPIESIKPGNIIDKAYYNDRIEYYKVTKGQRMATPFMTEKAQNNTGGKVVWERWRAGNKVGPSDKDVVGNDITWELLNDKHYELKDGRQVPLNMPPYSKPLTVSEINTIKNI